ncbi:MAG: hypothetical protein WD847_19915 [Pirellulales bacterium]
MRNVVSVAALGLWLAVGGGASAQDAIKKVGGETLRGTVKGMTRTEVTLDDKQVPVVQIESIRFDKEPPQLNAIRNQVANGGYDNALRSLEKIDAGKVERAEVKQEIEFYRALANARLALGGGADVNEAGKQMLAFVRDHSDNFHVLVANEVLGDLLVAARKFELATQYYAAMGEAPFPEYKMRAGVATGRALVAQNKLTEAAAQFDLVLALEAAGPVADAQRQAATLGKATCLAEQGQADEAIKLVEAIIAALPAEDAELHARAYVTLGNCYRKKPGATKQALLAFLHVDVLYFANPQAHAEALWNLAVLWNEVGKPERAVEATQLLRDRYANSQWAAR